MQTEAELRVDLAACFRLIHLYGWDDIVFTHISVRVPGPGHQFLINRFDLTFEEITASNLVKVDFSGDGAVAREQRVNPAGLVIHSAIQESRPDAECVVHCHTQAGIAVSSQRDGLLPVSQQAMLVLGSLGYHDYEGLVLHDDEKPRLVKSLGQNEYLMLRHHGLLTVGRTVADAFKRMYTLQRACETQIMAQSGGAALAVVAPAARERLRDDVRRVTKGNDGALIWPALLRRLDRLDPGYKD
ncbi:MULTISPECIES: class II aldolase/adducin family protein [Paraburkholderia]|uniref:class II aldolase/adducin family protein n=1 Tax=Paraburkholderia TaxID=1822464 RepID=UPI00224DF484|nr:MULTISPECIES: class II aldolase/adducin family protein [Paraburkholderia]MCX4160200.1 class II aldolase/adducin family protein [Paraburkholderia megapolitana]MDN7155699.1 class II aldolase/adducin family protein [Paraburkholderia sp. CHISQ3]MDQ6492743.1 class II aldolase/adducin family protein [Paraburkholderia megapolitana]